MAGTRRSFGDVLAGHRGVGPGFDAARLLLAFSVLGWHSILLTRGSYLGLLDTPLWVANFAILPMFFGLSGFLVAASAQRLDLANFLLNRAWRILPALMVEVGLSALVLGPLLTTLPLRDYFADRDFAIYFLNIVGFIHYLLPGTFEANPVSSVNGSLWTVPYEIICYAVMAAMIATGIVRRGSAMLATAVAIVAASTAVQALTSFGPSLPFGNGLLRQYLAGGKGPGLVPCFVLGAALYAARHRVPFDARLLIAALLILAGFGLFLPATSWTFTPSVLLAAPAMIYIVCYVGLTELPRIPYFWRGDYSYGIYLYAYPIQQALIEVLPARLAWPAHMAASMFLVTAFATASWHLIEKPVLATRKRHSFLARREAERETAGETRPPA